MAFIKNGSPLYFKAAQDAVHLEQSEQYREAAREWSQAIRLARNRNNPNANKTGRHKKEVSMRLIREESIEKHLVREVQKIGGIAYKFVSPGRRGVPDRLVALPNGKIIFVECKAPGEKPTPFQLREHARLFALGHQVIVLDGQDLSSILQPCEL